MKIWHRYSAAGYLQIIDENVSEEKCKSVYIYQKSAAGKEVMATGNGGGKCNDRVGMKAA